ncbi:MAG TPA: hypothetical protein VGP72_17620 [Planctomycetota bacterium]|jgi:hypothetical protein
MRKRKLHIALSLLLSLLIVQVITYLLLAESAMPAAGLRANTHYDFIRNSGFVLTSWQHLTPAQRSGLESEIRRYASMIYHHPDEVPDANKHFAPLRDYEKEYFEQYRVSPAADARFVAMRAREIAAGHSLDGYRDGVSVGWHLDRQNWFWMECSSWIWASTEGSESSSDVFVWVLGGWVHIRRIRGVVS